MAVNWNRNRPRPWHWPFKPPRTNSAVHLAAHSSTSLNSQSKPEISVASPQSQSFSRSYGPILPTSLTYIILSTRGYSPWRPDAVMGTNRCGINRISSDFHGPLWTLRTLCETKCSPKITPFLQIICFQGTTSVEKKRQRFPGNTPAVQVQSCYHSLSTSRLGNCNPIPFRANRAKLQIFLELTSHLGSANPCPNAVHMEPFPTSAFKVLI